MIVFLPDSCLLVFDEDIQITEMQRKLDYPTRMYKNGKVMTSQAWNMMKIMPSILDMYEENNVYPKKTDVATATLHLNNNAGP